MAMGEHRRQPGLDVLRMRLRIKMAKWLVIDIVVPSTEYGVRSIELGVGSPEAMGKVDLGLSFEDRIYEEV